jgi:hypothetical protein
MVEPVEYGFRCTFDSNGEIYTRSSETPLWRFETLRRNNRWVFRDGLFRLLPNFSFLDAAGDELFRVRCTRRYPVANFVMEADGSPVCALRQLSLLRNRYAFEFNAGARWTFRIRLFSIYGEGTCEGTAGFKIRMTRHDTWHVLVSPGFDSPQLVAAVASVHRELQRWR